MNAGPLDYSVAMYCVSWFQHVTEVILVSSEADLRADSNDSSPMCISCKITKLCYIEVNVNIPYNPLQFCIRLTSYMYCISLDSCYRFGCKQS